MEIKKSILEKASSAISSRVIRKLGEETRGDVEAIVNEAFRGYRALKGHPKRAEIITFVKTEASRIRGEIENWK